MTTRGALERLTLSRYGSAELGQRVGAGPSQDAAEQPHDEGHARRRDVGVNGARRREDAAANDDAHQNTVRGGRPEAGRERRRPWLLAVRGTAPAPAQGPSGAGLVVVAMVAGKQWLLLLRIIDGRAGGHVSLSPCLPTFLPLSTVPLCGCFESSDPEAGACCKSRGGRS